MRNRVLKYGPSEPVFPRSHDIGDMVVKYGPFQPAKPTTPTNAIQGSIEEIKKALREVQKVIDDLWKKVEEIEKSQGLTGQKRKKPIVFKYGTIEPRR